MKSINHSTATGKITTALIVSNHWYGTRMPTSVAFAVWDRLQDGLLDVDIDAVIRDPIQLHIQAKFNQRAI